MYVDHLQCMHCNASFEEERGFLQCPCCDGKLDVVYDYAQISEVLSPQMLSHHEDGLWKYEALLPVRKRESRVTLGEGGTPLIKADILSREIGLSTLYLKNETQNPTGSFKDRSMSVGMSKARENGKNTVMTASSGNAAIALAAYAARAGAICYAFVPEHIPPEKTSQLLIYGARVIRCRSIDDEDPCYTLMMMGMNHFGWYPLPSSGVFNPYTGEGLKTIAYEICEQLHYTPPHWIIIPMGAGTLLSGTMKGLREFYQLGYIDTIPRLAGIQATGCAPLVKAFQENSDPSHIAPWPHPQTIAGGLIDPYPWDAGTALSALEKTGGMAHAVTDEKIREAQILLGKTEGIFAEASGAASLAGLIELVECGYIDKKDSVVVEITGCGLKESGRFLTTIHSIPILSPDLPSLLSTMDSLQWRT
jgi:threonine synthase